MKQLPIIDCDVHHHWKSDAEVGEYLPARWRDFVRGSRDGLFPIQPASATYSPSLGTNKRIDAFGPEGLPPGSDYRTMKEQLLDPFNVERAVLVYDVGLNVGVPNVYLATALAQAANDWSIERWLSGLDERLYGGLLIPTQVPEEAAKEIRRAGKHPRMAAVLMVFNGLGRPFGHPVYHPIYEAAAEVGLPVAIHNGGDSQLGSGPTLAAGMPSSRLEFHTLLTQSMITHLVSFLTHGVFEKFPDLRVLLMEFGIAWIPWVLWNLDRHAPLLRNESPWIRRQPSEYIRKHVRVSTQPLEMSPEPEQLMELLESAGGVDDLLLFASDYPHWDTDDPRYIARRLPASWWRKVAHENALDFYRWPEPAPARRAG